MNLQKVEVTFLLEIPRSVLEHNVNIKVVYTNTRKFANYGQLQGPDKKKFGYP